MDSNIVIDHHELLVASINMTPEEEKTREQSEINEEILQRFRALQNDYLITTIVSAIDGSTSLPIRLRVSGNDLKELEKIADETVAKLNNIEELVSIQTETGESTYEYVFRLDDKKMEEDGVTLEYLYTVISQKFFDIPAGELMIDGEMTPLKINNDLTIENRDKLLKETIPTMYGEKQLANYVSLEKTSSLGEINRHNGERYIHIVADYQGQDLGKIQREIQQVINDLHVDEGYSVSFIGDLEQQQQMMEDLFIIFALSILFVYRHGSPI
mgnify:FL=1